MNRPTIAWSFILGASLLLGFVQGAQAAGPGECTVSADTVIDSSYIEANDCNLLEFTGTPVITWSGTIDTGRAVRVRVNTGVSVTFDGGLTMGHIGSSFTVSSTASVLTVMEDSRGISIVAPTIIIDGVLEGNGRGCQGGDAGANGHGPDENTGVCDVSLTGAGAYPRGGASHGGAGGAGLAGNNAQTSLYSNPTAPGLLGSSGAGGDTGEFGGAGGGYIHVQAGVSLRVNGSIRANGNDGTNAGAGSGGSIDIHANIIDGTGTIEANGGDTTQGGGGGGGRISIYYNTNSGFDFGQAQALGGTGAGGSSTPGVKGSAYILNRLTDDGAGDVLVTSGFDFIAGNYHRDSYTFLPGAVLKCNNPGSIDIEASTTIRMNGVSWTCTDDLTSLTVSSSQLLWISGSTLSFTGEITSATFFGSTGINSTSSNLSFPDTQNMLVLTHLYLQSSGTNLSVTRSTAYTQISQGPSDLTFNNFTFTGATDPGSAFNAGRLSFAGTPNLTLTNSHIYSSVSSTFYSLSIDGTSSIDASGRGCSGGTGNSNGHGPDPLSGQCNFMQAGSGYGSTLYGGASHAGTGGRGSAVDNTQSTIYGSSTKPLLVGSGGGGGDMAHKLGGNGGGLLRLQVLDKLTLDGDLKADGGNGISAGGGSGGSIYITAIRVDGSGSMSANGGSVTGADGGGGGGGRVMIEYTNLGSFDDAHVSVLGGAHGTGGGSVDGSAGSFPGSFQSNTTPNAPSLLGPADLVNGSTTSTNEPILTFTLADPDPSDTLRFHIQIAPSSTFDVPTTDYTSELAASGSRSFQIGQFSSGDGFYTYGHNTRLNTEGSYFWRVQAIDQNGARSSYASGWSMVGPSFAVDFPTYTIGFQQPTGSGLESITATSVILTLSTPNSEDARVHYTFTGTATGDGVDFTGVSATATILAGQTTTSIPFTITNDSAHESTQTIIITLTYPWGNNITLGSDTYTYSILDDDAFVASTSTVCGSGCTFTTLHEALTTVSPGDTLTVGASYDPSGDTSYYYLTADGVTIDCLNSGAVIGQTNLVGNSQLYLADNTIIRNCTFGNITLISNPFHPSNIRILNNTFSSVATSSINFESGAQDFLIQGNTNIGHFRIGNGATSTNGTIQDNTFYFGSFSQEAPFEMKRGAEVDHVAIVNNSFESYTTQTTANSLIILVGSDGSFVTNTVRFMVTPSSTMQGAVDVRASSTFQFSGNIIQGPDISDGDCAAVRFGPESAYQVVHFDLSSNTMKLPSTCNSAVGILVTDNAQTGAMVTSDVHYNIVSKEGAMNDGDQGIRLEAQNGIGTSLSMTNSYNAVYRFSNPLHDKNNNTGASLDENTFFGNPFFRTGNVSEDDDYELAPFSPYLDINGSMDIGAVTGTRRSIVTVDASGSVNYSSVDATTTASIGDFFRSGDTLQLQDGVYAPFSVSSTLATTTLTITGLGSSVIIDGNLSAQENGIRLASVTSSAITNLTIRNASGTTQGTYVIDLIQGIFNGNTYDQASIDLGTPASSTFYVTDSGPAFYTSSGFDFTEPASAATDFSLALVRAGGTDRITFLLPLSFIPDAHTLEVISEGSFTVDAFATSTFIYDSENQTYSFNQAALDEAGITLPPWIDPTPDFTKVPGAHLSGIRLDGSHGVTITHVTSTNNGNGISFGVGSGGNTVSQGTLSGSVGYDVNHESSLGNTFDRISFTRTSSTFSSAGDLLVIDRVRARTVATGSSAAIQSATVIATSSHAVLTSFGSTDSSGYTAYQNLPLYQLSGSNQSVTAGGYNPYHFAATATAYDPGVQDASIDSNSYTVTITLAASSVVEEAPRSGGGGGGGGGGGASPSSIGSLATTTTAPGTVKVPVPTPIILEPSPVIIPVPEPVPTPTSTPVLPDLPVWPLEDGDTLTAGLRVKRDLSIEARTTVHIKEDLKALKISATPFQINRLQLFMAYGNSWATMRLGEGERRAVLKDLLETLATPNLSAVDLDRVTRGVKPFARNLKQEQKQLEVVRRTFRRIYKHDPIFSTPSENLAWNALMYRLRFPRVLAAESEGIRRFQTTYGSKPQTPYDWATVRVMGYVK